MRNGTRTWIGRLGVVAVAAIMLAAVPSALAGRSHHHRGHRSHHRYVERGCDDGYARRHHRSYRRHSYRQSRYYDAPPYRVRMRYGVRSRYRPRYHYTPVYRHRHSRGCGCGFCGH